MKSKKSGSAKPRTSESEARREFLKKVGKASAAAPAAALLLAASAKSADAQPGSGQCQCSAPRRGNN